MIRIGILINNYHLKGFQLEALQEALSLSFAEAVVLIVKKETYTEKRNFSISKLANPHLLFKQYSKFYKPYCYKLFPLPDQLKNLPVIEAETIKENANTDRFSDDTVNKIKSYNLNVLLRFGFNILKGEILHAAKEGVWSFHHGNEMRFRGGPPLFWEIIKGEKTAGVILQRLTTKLDGGVVLRKGYWSVSSHSYLFFLNQVMMESSVFIKQALTDLHYGLPRAEGNSASKAPVYKYPSNKIFLKFLLIQFFARIKFHLNRLFKAEKWAIGYSKMNPRDFLFADKRQNFKWIELRGDGYYADPFFHVKNNLMFIICEKYKYRKGIGEIASINIATGKHLTLKEFSKGHFSFPFTFSHEGVDYCLPENCDSGKLTLYEFHAGNDEWKPVSVLLEIPAVDPVLFYYENCWWLFLTRKDKGTNHHLFIYYSESLKGPYKEHKNNPVKTDISSARMAGALFISDNQLYRPSQNSASAYGSSVKINKITALSSIAFREECVNEIFPFHHEYNKGIHTLSFSSGYVLTDSKKYCFSPGNFLNVLLKK